MQKNSVIESAQKALSQHTSLFAAADPIAIVVPVPGNVQVHGEADAAAVVTVNENPAWRSGEYFYGGDYADNTLSATNKPVEISAVTGRVFVAKTPEVFTYDADGNMTSDGRFTYFWNDENRLVCASNAEVVVTYAYDHKGRMIRKDIMRTGSATVHIEYTWDGWNIIREAVATNSLFTIHSSLFTYNLWGLDLDGTLQGAGGVGGLLAVVRDGETYLPTYDANGNISEYVSAADGSVAAHYDYSPFGETLISSGLLASSFKHRFSTKPWCPVTGFCEYQYRKYRPDIGRWMSRDPMGEGGGLNLHGFCINDGVGNFDYLGEKSLCDCIDISVYAVRKCVWKYLTHADYIRVLAGNGNHVAYREKDDSTMIKHDDLIMCVTVYVIPKEETSEDCECKEVGYEKLNPYVEIKSINGETSSGTWGIVYNMNGQSTYDRYITQYVPEYYPPYASKYDVKVSIGDEECLHTIFYIA